MTTMNDRILELAGVTLTEAKTSKLDSLITDLMNVWKKMDEPELQSEVKKYMKKAYALGSRDGETNTLLGPGR